MLKKLLPLLLLILSKNTLAFDFPIEITEYIGDIKISADINKNDINASPQWTPFESKLPLSIAEALAAIKTYLSTDSELIEATLTGIELKQIPHHESHWHYLVEVSCTNEDKIQPHFFIVLMDGKVIPALKRVNSIK